MLVGTNPYSGFHTTYGGLMLTYLYTLWFRSPLTHLLLRLFQSRTARNLRISCNRDLNSILRTLILKILLLFVRHSSFVAAVHLTEWRDSLTTYYTRSDTKFPRGPCYKILASIRIDTHCSKLVRLFPSV